MKKVPHFAGTLLAIGTVVVALNSGPTVPVESAPIKASVTAPLVGVETTRLFSAVRMDDYQAITAPAVPKQPHPLGTSRSKRLQLLDHLRQFVELYP